MEDDSSATPELPARRLKQLLRIALTCLMASTLWAMSLPSEPPLPCGGIHFCARDQHLSLMHPLGRDPQAPTYLRSSRAKLDTLSNWYSPSRQYVEIIRQDHPTKPHYGLALGFEFREDADTFPYAPAYARVHFKDFTWGGLEFSLADSFNYTGVNNEVSNDLTIRITAFHNDTIEGYFSAVLLSGAGPMLHLDSGTFCVMLRRLAY